MTSASGSPQRLRFREHQLFVALSVVIGILAGLAAVLFTLAIERADRVFFGFSASPLRTFLVPALVSLVAGILLTRVFTGARGSGVPQTKAAFHLHDGHIPGRVPLGKFITGVLCVGCGHSLGREGPSVQIGAGIASAAGRWLGLPAHRVRELIPVGAAGALAAAFNTPIAAVLFALEEIIGDLNATLIGSTVVASVASVVMQRSILGNEPLFHVPEYQLVHPAELIGYVALGIVGGTVSLLFCKTLLALRGAFLRLPRATLAMQPAIGGATIGAILLFVPEVKGVGYAYVDQALNGDLVFRMMILLGVVKLGATVISYCSGNAGGIFAPSLYIGAMAGGAVGTVITMIAPFPTAGAGAYALVGMGTLFAGIIRAPITSVFMIFEITQDYQILVPLMVANLLSFVISRHYQPIPVYEALLRQDHVHLPRPAFGDTTGGRRARDMMNRDVRLIDGAATIQDAWDVAEREPRQAYLVGTRDHLLGVLTREQLRAAYEAHRNGDRISALIGDRFVHAHPDHPLDVVIERFAETPEVLPVVSRDDNRRLEGVITAEDLTRVLTASKRRAP